MLHDARYASWKQSIHNDAVWFILDEQITSEWYKVFVSSSRCAVMKVNDIQPIFISKRSFVCCVIADCEIKYQKQRWNCKNEMKYQRIYKRPLFEPRTHRLCNLCDAFGWPKKMWTIQINTTKREKNDLKHVIECLVAGHCRVKVIIWRTLWCCAWTTIPLHQESHRRACVLFEWRLNGLYGFFGCWNHILIGER